MGNRPEWLIADFAITLLGAVMVGVNTWATARELQHILSHSDTRFLITVARFLKHDYAAILPGLDLPQLERIVCVGDGARPEWLSYPELLTASIPEAALDAAQRAVRPEDMAYLLYTSGSTSLPKGVEIQHYALIENMWHIGERQKVTEHDRLWLAVSLFWGLGCENALFNLLTHGGCVVLQEHFDAGGGARADRARALHRLLRHAEHGAGALRASRPREARSVQPARRRHHRHARADHARGGARRARDLQHLRPHRDLRQLQRRRRARPAREAHLERRPPAPRRRAAHRRSRHRQDPSRGRSRRNPRQGLRHHRLLQGPRAHARGLRRARLLPHRRPRACSTPRATSTSAAASRRW